MKDSNDPRTTGANRGKTGSVNRTARPTGTSKTSSAAKPKKKAEPTSLKERSRRNRKKTKWEQFVEIVQLLWKKYRLQTVAVLILLVLILICILVKCSAGNNNNATPTPGTGTVTEKTDTETVTDTRTVTEEKTETAAVTEDSSTETEEGVIGECESVTTETDFTVEDKDGWAVDKLMLVNWSHRLKYSGEPEDLVNMTDYMTDSRYIFVDSSLAKGNKEAVIALNKMCVDAMDAGCSNVKFSATGTYRTYEVQDAFWQNHLEEDSDYGSDPYNNPTRTVPATVSEHRTGLGFDIWLVEYDYDWLHDNSYKYGFVLRYPSEKKSITGIIYEQWHFRYVGVEAATEMHELGFCLEEYIAYKNGADITPYPTSAPTTAPTKSANTPTPTPKKDQEEKKDETETVTVPNLVNKSEADAISLLESLGLDYTFGEGEYNNEIAAGRIYSQSVKSGTEVKVGTTINLETSLGPEPVIAEDTPTPTPTPAAEATATPTPTPEPAATDTPTPTPTPEPETPEEPDGGEETPEV